MSGSDLKILVWDGPTRLFHWLAATLVVAAYVTWRLNWKLANPSIAVAVDSSNGAPPFYTSAPAKPICVPRRPPATMPAGPSLVSPSFER